MFLPTLSRGAIAAIVGATMLAASSAPSSAFTLASPSLEQPVVGADVQSVWWRGGWHRGWGGGWHRGWAYGGGWHRWGWGGGWGPRYGYGFAPVHCWWGPWGRRCGV